VSDRDPDGDPVTLELHIADEPIAIAARDGETKVTLGPASDPDATLTGPERPILGLLFGVVDRAGAEAMGVTLEGDPKVIDRFAAEAAAAA
jgi:hypothetical protein